MPTDHSRIGLMSHIQRDMPASGMAVEPRGWDDKMMGESEILKTYGEVNVFATIQGIHKYAVALGAAVIMSAAPALAEMPAPKGEVILTIEGKIAGGTPIDLDLEGLQTLPKEVFQTTTIWTEGNLEFTGVPLKSLLAEAGAEGEAVSAEALNGYAVDIPLSELDEKAPIIAYFIDGETFSRREKGPLWVVFPYDGVDKYKSETSYAYSIWQLRKLTVK